MEQSAPQTQPKYLRQRQLLEHLPFSAATLWRMVGSGDFPKPIKLSERVTCWLWSDVEEYLQSCKEAIK